MTSARRPRPSGPRPRPSGRPRRAGRRATRMWVGAAAALLGVAVLAIVAAAPSGGNRSPASATASARAQSATGQVGPVPSASPAATATGNPFASLETRVPGDPLALGSVHAPVIMVEWADFQCPFCGRFARTTEPVLIRKYVDTGKLRIEWRDFPYLGPQSTTAAEAARAAADQGKFWAYHNALYAHQHPVNSGALTTGYLTGLAARLGLDMPRFRADMTSAATARAVKADFQQGTGLGINGTPAFIVGSTPVMGAQPTATFEKVINAALARAG